jgi:hypothetical protein
LPSPRYEQSARGRENEALLDDATIEGMKEYFHLQNHDRDVLLKYLRNTLAFSKR